VGSYRPQPIDTSKIWLSPGVSDLLEKLASNNHDHWAQKRFQEGWRHGPVRNDDLKQHPDLVPYDELSEPEKEYDRKTVTETLKAIIALGYEIKGP
jgi:RyR domain